MNKVIKIEDETVYVGKGDNGQFTAISRKSFGFEPQVGDYVEFYQNGDEYIVSKIDNASPATSSQHSNGVSDKSKLAAALFALFLGALGGYDFYIGNSKQGYKRIGITLFIYSYFNASCFTSKCYLEYYNYYSSFNFQNW